MRLLFPVDFPVYQSPSFSLMYLFINNCTNKAMNIVQTNRIRTEALS